MFHPFFTFTDGTTPPPVVVAKPSGGGRVFGYFEAPPPRPKVILTVPARDKLQEKELIRLIRLDAELRARREQELQSLIRLTEHALDVANTVQITADLTAEQIKRLRKRLEDEDILLILT